MLAALLKFAFPWAKAVEVLLKYGPMLFDLVMEILDLMETHQHQLKVDGASSQRLEQEFAVQQAKVDIAVAHYNDTKGDRRMLHDVRDDMRRACGFECRPIGGGNRN